jgi:hypothetical protein
MQEEQGPLGNHELKPRDGRSRSEWAARWITWLLAVVGATVLSAVAAYAVALVVPWLVGALGIPRGHRMAAQYGLHIALMGAPVPVLWVSWTVAPAARWIVTAALCAVAMGLVGLPRPGDGWHLIALWLLTWIPSWGTLGFLWRSDHRRRGRQA